MKWGMLFIMLFTLSAMAMSPAEAWAQEEEKVEKKGGKNFFEVTYIAIKTTTIEFKVAFGILSIVTVALVVILLLDLRMSSAIPSGFVDEFSDMVNARQFKAAFDLCKTDNSFLAKVLSTGMGRLQYGVEDARHAAFNTVESIRSNKAQVVNYLAIIGTVAPMVGLFGTVRGMIGAFDVMGSSAQPSPSRLAGEISNALGTTFLGIAVAVVALLFTTFFQNRLTRMAMDTANLGDDLLTQMFHNSKKPGAPAPAGGAPAPAGGAPVGGTPRVAPPPGGQANVKPGN